MYVVLKLMDSNGKHVRATLQSISCFIFNFLAKLVPVAYGVLKLQINCVVEDDKIGTDFLEEEITKFEDLVR